MRNSDARRVRVALAAGLLALVGLTPAAPARASSFDGRAFGAFVNVLGAGPLYIADTGALDPGGGWSGTTLEHTTVPAVLAAETLVAATSGALTDTAGHQVNSSTSLANVVVLPGGPAQLTASFVRAQAGATDVGAAGSSEIADLTFGGVSVAVTGLPNQRVDLPGVATLIINEQTTTPGGVVVSALHLILATGGDVIVSSATSSISR